MSSENSAKTSLALPPAPAPDAETEATAVQSNALKLDDLGPMVVNSDGVRFARVTSRVHSVLIERPFPLFLLDVITNRQLAEYDSNGKRSHIASPCCPKQVRPEHFSLAVDIDTH